MPRCSFPRMALSLAIAASVLLPSCSKPQEEDAYDPLVLLDRYNSIQRRYDPLDYVEVDLGEFYITYNRQDTPSTLVVDFHLYGVIHKSQQAQFAELLTKHHQSMRDAVIRMVQGADMDQLTDPSLGILRSELVPAIGKTLRTTALRDVVFTSYTLQ